MAKKKPKFNESQDQYIVLVSDGDDSDVWIEVCADKEKEMKTLMADMKRNPDDYTTNQDGEIFVKVFQLIDIVKLKMEVTEVQVMTKKVSFKGVVA